uniref:Uncharacterized protein n=1 Tax=Arion vulgaris TaxID=1028688 RepID=A0A0B7A6Z2_9EUPU
MLQTCTLTSSDRRKLVATDMKYLGRLLRLASRDRFRNKDFRKKSGFNFRTG